MLIPIDVGAAVESRPVANGVYDLTVLECEDTKSQAGKPQMVLTIGIDGHENAPNVRHYASFPAEGEEKKKSDFKVLLLKRLLTLFKQPIPNAIDTTKMAMGLVGAKAKAELILSEPDEKGNVYNRLVLPFIKDGNGGNGGAVPQPPKR